MSFHLRSYQITLVANTPVQFGGGTYFTIEEATDEVDVKFLKGDGEQVGICQNVGSGFWTKTQRFGLVEIESATAQTISVIIGGGPDAASVEFGVNKTTTSIGGGQLTARTLVTSTRVQPAGAGVTTVVTPAANTNGIRIDLIASGFNNAGIASVMSKTSAPTGVTDSAARLLHYDFQGSTGIYHNHTIPTLFPYIIPAGEGLYVYASAAAGDVGISYEVL